MKKSNFTRIISVVLSLALLLGAVLCVGVVAEEVSTEGKFGSISVSYGDKVFIRVKVNATEEEITAGETVVSYTLNGETKDATYYTDADEGVWVITEGIAAFDLAKEVVFNSYVGETQVEFNRTYSVAQYLYKMLYTDSGITAEFRTLYEALLAYGEAAQIALGKDTDKLVTDSTIAFTENADVSLDGSRIAFAPAQTLTLTPVWNGALTAEQELIGWNVIDNGEEKVEGLTFTCSGSVEIVSPVIGMKDTSAFELANGDFENGLEGWTVVGNIGAVSSDTHYWLNDPESAEGFAFGMDGEGMFSAYAPGATEAAVGTLTSSSFTVGGSGFVTFKLGAMKDGNSVYVDVVDAETKEILARYYNGLWAERTEGVKSGCTLVAYKADLSAFLGRDVFFRISDNAVADYGLFFADSFVTYYASEPQGFADATPVDYEVSGTIYDLFNGGFEMGGLQGWQDNGAPGKVTAADAFWNGRLYGKNGTYLYSGVQDQGGEFLEGNTGTLTSSVFEIGGTGYISFMLGGGGNQLCFVQVIDAVTGEILARYHQQAQDEGVLVQYVADLSAYIGRAARIQVVDKATSEWGCVSFDNVVTYYPAGAALPEGAITADNIYDDLKYTIDNGSFESGTLDGWHMDGAIGAVTSTEPESEWYTKNDGIKDGDYLFAFWHQTDVNEEGGTGTLTSSTFSLKQGSFISFKFGGAGGEVGNPNHDVWVELCRADGSVIARFYNDAEGKANTRMNAYFYQYNDVEVNCFIRIVDNSGSNYGGAVVDAFQVNLESAPEGYLAAIQ